MKPFSVLLLLTAASSSASSSWAQGRTTQATPPAGGGTSALTTLDHFVRLQPGSPGGAQPGSSHISGTAMAGQFVANSVSGTGVTSTGADNGVLGISSNPGSAGLYGENWPGFGVVGRSNYVSVWGDAIGGGVGVHGASVWPSGTGVYAQGGYYGVYAQGGTYGVVSNGTAYVAGDLVVTGSKTGYVVDLIKNGDSVPLAPGDLVEIAGSEPAVLGDIPLVIVRRASSANARAVLGPISNAIEVRPELMPPTARAAHAGEGELFVQAQTEAKPGILRIEGSIRPGALGNVVTLGAFSTLKVDARFGAIQPGDLLVASPEPGFAMSDPDPRVGTVIGKALGAWSAGQGEIPVMVSSR